MAGVKGLRFRQRNAERHRLRTDKAYRFKAECEKRRANTVVRLHGLSYIRIRVPERFSLEEAVAWYDLGFQVPLDLVPVDYWFDDKAGMPRFGEEMLGADF